MTSCRQSAQIEIANLLQNVQLVSFAKYCQIALRILVRGVVLDAQIEGRRRESAIHRDNSSRVDFLERRLLFLGLCGNIYAQDQKDQYTGTCPPPSFDIAHFLSFTELASDTLMVHAV